MTDIRSSSMGGVPKGTTANRPSSPSIGDVYYNGTLGCLEIYTSSGWVANSAPPSIPSSVSATYTATNQPYNNGSASISFTPGTGGGLPNTYRVTSSPGNITTTGSSSPIVISGLQSGTQYTFSITGNNSFGTSNSSTASNSITANTVPQAPTIGTLSYASATSLSLTFTAGATGGSAITNYKYSTDGINYTAFSPAQTSSPLTISGLTSNTTYSFYIKAVNANGDSEASQLSNSSFTGTVISGGTLTSDATYYYRTFTSSGTLSLSGPTLTCDVLLVAGGAGSGGGGSSGYYAGGGGAGGLISLTGSSISSGNNSIVVGAGGAGGTQSADNGYVGTNGSNTTFLGNTAIGGGGGGGNTSSVTNIYGTGTSYGADGGSGGGGGLYNGKGGGGTTNQGNKGGDTTSTASGGGGGRGSAGGNATSSVGGSAGQGVSSAISGTATIFAGGGAGAGSSGSGSTPNGGTAVNANGTANTGNGGGGVYATAGRTGGSGIVVVRYLKSAVGG